MDPTAEVVTEFLTTEGHRRDTASKLKKIKKKKLKLKEVGEEGATEVSAGA